MLFSIFCKLILFASDAESVGSNAPSFIYHPSTCHQHKDIYDSFVCLCNENVCDTLKSTLLPPSGWATLYSSDSKSDRLAGLSRPKEDFTIEQPSPALIANILKDKTHQTLLGFGGAFTDAASMVIRSLPAKLCNLIIENYYDPNKGIGYTFGRVPIGLTDFSVRNYSYDETEEDHELKNFKLSEEDVKFKIPLIKQAKSYVKGLKLFGSAWFPPKWLLSPKRYDAQGQLIGPQGGKYFQTWANYNIKFLKDYEKRGLHFWGITSGNEPWFATQNIALNISTPFDPKSLATFVNVNLGPTLVNHGYTKDKFHLLIVDEVVIPLLEYVDAIMANQSAVNWVTGIAYHWYFNFESGYSTYEKLNEKYPNLIQMSTEACIVEDGKPVKLGDWRRAERYISDIIDTLNRNSVAWIDWNLALDLEGGPNRIKNFVDAPIIVDKNLKTFYRQPIFYAMAHFSKFIQPQAKRCSIEIIKPDPDIMLTAFINPSGYIVVVILNKSVQEKTVQLNNLNEHSVYLKLFAKSVVTFIIKP